jgi:hypothetical protein
MGQLGTGNAGRVQMILGLLYKVKKKCALAVQHLIEAKQILSQFGKNSNARAGRNGARGIGTKALT